MTQSVKKVLTVFSETELARIQNIFLGKGLKDKDLEIVKKTLRDCLIAMVEYRHICYTMTGSEFAIKGRVIVETINKAEAKLESFGTLTEGDFRALTVLLVNKSTIYTHHAIQNAIREAISV
ncbi:MAG: hypothetical protein WCI63_02880 [bacterium]